MKDLKALYENSTSATISAAKAMGTKDGNRGVNFLDGSSRGRWSPTSPGAPDDVWQEGITENSQGTNINPAATNNGTYPLSRWKPDSLLIAFEKKGPNKLSSGYWGNTRFTEFKDSAGRWTEEGSKLHKYAPLSGKQYSGGTKELGLNLWANARVKAGATSTSVGGING